MTKLLRELSSLKIWMIMIASVLLVKGYLSENTWATVVSLLFGMREASEVRHNLIGENSDHTAVGE